jgi:hypothetical protein
MNDFVALSSSSKGIRSSSRQKPNIFTTIGLKSVNDSIGLSDYDTTVQPSANKVIKLSSNRNNFTSKPQTQ